MDIHAAIPCGMIINELVTNAFKHAFREMIKGKIEIFVMQNNNEYYIKISDNGVGLPEKYLKGDTNSLGMVIVNTLAKQLKADIKIESEQGTKFSFAFKKQVHERSTVKAFS